MLITVTQAHIDNGSRACTDCPVALAIHDITDSWRVEVDYSRIAVTPESGKWGPPIFYVTPRIAADFILRFDSGESVSPFEFELS